MAASERTTSVSVVTESGDLLSPTELLLRGAGELIEKARRAPKAYVECAIDAVV